MIRSIKHYNGSKAGAGTYQNVISQIPKCDVFIDAMAGSLGVTANLSLPALTVINDVDQSIYERSLLPAVKPGVLAFNLSYSVMISMFKNFLGTVVLYLDPPYMMSTRSSQKKYYMHDWDDDDHRRLILDVCSLPLPFHVMISHYPCDQYDKLVSDYGWRRYDFKSMTRSGLRDESIYMNFSKPSILQDSRYVGTDFTDRQRILRKAQRWYSKLSRLPVVEKQYILDYLAMAADSELSRIVKGEFFISDICVVPSMNDQNVEL